MDFNKKPTKGWAVDAMCEGNPGPAKYRCIDLETGEIVFQNSVGFSTNNITEFLAIVHAIGEAKKRNINPVIYSDSFTALTWVKNKKANSGLKSSPLTVKSIQLKNRAESFLSNLNIKDENGIMLNIDGITVMKWYTLSWGEIPADYGRK